MQHQNNAPVTWPGVRKYATWLKTTSLMLEQTPYLPVLAMCSLFSFPKISKNHQGTHLGDVQALERAMSMALKGVFEESFQGSVNA